ncbi:MAG: amidohydrolase family protein [Chloroflexi bacterium]|nr:amidohydrolase family protein [Chloroflexota bacterium]
MTDRAQFTLLTAAHVFEGTDAAPIQGGGVLLEGPTIVRVGRGDGLRAPDGATVERHDYPSATIVPGFVDAHTHVTPPGDGTFGEAVGATPDDILLLQATANVRRMLELGVTTARENGAKNHTTFSLCEGIRRGIIPGPRMVICGRPVCTTGGHLWFFGQEADGVDGVRHAVRELIKEGADWIKITATGGSTKASDPYRPSFTLEELRAIVDEAHARAKLTGAHTTSSAAIERVLDAGVDMIIHCTFWNPDGSKAYRPDLAERIANEGRWVNPTLYGGMYTETEGLQERRARDGRLSAEDEANLVAYAEIMDLLLDHTGRMIRAGVKMVAGSDTAWRFGRAGGLAKEVYWLGQAGLSNADAIRAGTSRSAEAIGVGEVAGTIAAGRQADLVVVDGNPLADLTALQRVEDVWQAGRRVPRTI